ncbi:MAG: 8-amino-7-oxononanoate synthase [Desulfobulbaceae bacterium]|jgi:8-amino-7-oxononanoate synthase|nr:8-amino-7-oxononanoate synthase [Desulfobulbaceae bacterium]
MDPLSWLEQRKADGLLRKLHPLQRQVGQPLAAVHSAAPLIDFSSNDYLALSHHPRVIESGVRYLKQYGAGAGAARLMSGDCDYHHELERAIAGYKGKASALLFGNGYMANSGMIPALVGRHDVIFSDRLNHASIVDGCKLSGATVVRFRHNDTEHLQELLQARRGTGRALIVVESLYSMDGDRAPLVAIVRLKKMFDCVLLVDEAHATGLFGQTGSGLVEEEGVTDDVELVMGTFGKGLGSYGAYVAADQVWIDYLLNRARSFIYSTALPPGVIGASLGALQVIREEPWLADRLKEKTRTFITCLSEQGFQLHSDSQIVPLMIGASDVAMGMAGALQDRGFHVTAVRPPTVPEHTARLRFSVTLHHTDDDLRRLAEAVGAVHSR